MGSFWEEMEPSVWTTLFLVTAYLLGKVIHKYEGYSVKCISSYLRINQLQTIWSTTFPSALSAIAQSPAKPPGEGSRTRGWHRRAGLQGKVWPYYLSHFCISRDIIACKVKFGATFFTIFVVAYFCLSYFAFFGIFLQEKFWPALSIIFLPFLFVLLCIFGDIFACKVNFGATFCLQVLGHLAFGTVCRLSFDTFDTISCFLV